MMRGLVLRYALAPACLLVAVLVYLSPARALLPPAGLFVFAILIAAWFGGPGPGLLAATLAAASMPQLVPVSYPLLAGILDQPRFIAFSVIGLAVGWWGLRRRSVEAALRQSEQRYALAMQAAGDGHTDWDLVSGEFYISPRLLEIVGHPPDARFADRADWVRRFPFHPEDRPKWEAAVASHFAGRESHFKMELRIVVRGEVRWTAFHFLSTRDRAGQPIRWTGSIGDITEQKRVEEALRAREERFRALTALSSDFYWETDTEHRYTSIEFGEAYVGMRDVSQKLGRTRWEVRSEIDSPTPDEAGWAAHRAVCDAREPIVDFGFSRREDNGERFYEINGEPRFGTRG